MITEWCIRVALCVFIFTVGVRVLEGRPNWQKCFVFLSMAVYLLIVFRLTLLRSPREYRSSRLELLWGLRELVRWEDGKLIFMKLSVILRRQIVLNILLFVPFGYVMPYALRIRKPEAGMPVARVIAAGAFLSAGIETAQYFYRLGLCDLDDLVLNTLGCCVGLLLCYGASLVIAAGQAWMNRTSESCLSGCFTRILSGRRRDGMRW